MSDKLLIKAKFSFPDPTKSVHAGPSKKVYAFGRL